MKYGNKMFTKPEQSGQLKIVLKQKMKHYNVKNARKARMKRQRGLE